MDKALREAETGSSAAFPDEARLREAEQQSIREHSELKDVLQHIDTAQCILGQLQTDTDKLPWKWVGVEKRDAAISISLFPDSFRESLDNLAQSGCHSIVFLMEQAKEQLQNDKEQEQVTVHNVFKHKFNSTEAEQQLISRRREACKASLLAPRQQDLHSPHEVSNLLPLSNPLTLCNHNIPEHPCH